MRVLFSDTSSMYISRRAVERARELDARWAFPDEIPLVGEKEHDTWGPHWRGFVHDPKNQDEVWYEDEDAFLLFIESFQYHLPEVVPRHDPVLLQIFDELGGVEMEGTVTAYADDCPEDEKDRIRCVEVPDDAIYYVGSYCAEWISEQHRVWDEQTDVEGRPSGTPRFTFDKDSRYVPLGS
jgi:hypothetical protein